MPLITKLDVQNQTLWKSSSCPAGPEIGYQIFDVFRTSNLGRMFSGLISLRPPAGLGSLLEGLVRPHRSLVGGRGRRLAITSVKSSILFISAFLRQPSGSLGTLQCLVYDGYC